MAKRIKPWTESELDTLRALAGKQSTPQIARELDRTIGAIIQKAFELGVSLTMPEH